MSEDKYPEKIPEYIPSVGKDEASAAASAVEDGWISPLGPEVNELEERICELTQTSYGTATDSGTAALHLAIEALDLSPEDEIIIPDFTYGATGLAVTSSRVEPVIADVERSTLGLDPDSVEEQISSNTKAILVAHMFGRVADMERIMEIAEEHELYVIEDAAQAIGASLHGEKAGSIGDIGCFSFAWSKNITTGKGGMVVTDDQNLAEKVQKLADYGRASEERFIFDEKIGYNYLMDNIRAKIGKVQLNRFEDILEQKKEIFSFYRSELEDLDKIEFLDIEKRNNSRSVPTLFGIYVEERDLLRSWLEDRNVGTRKFFPPLHEMPAFSSYSDSSYPVAEEVASKGLTLPSHPDLSKNELDHIVDSVREFYEN